MYLSQYVNMGLAGLLYLLLEGSSATYKTLLTNPKLTNILKILTESVHNYLYQVLSLNLSQERWRCLHRHKRFLCELATTNSIRGKTKSYKINLLLNNHAHARAIIEPLLSSLKKQTHLVRFNNVSKVSSCSGKWGNGMVSIEQNETGDDAGTPAKGGDSPTGH